MANAEVTFERSLYIGNSFAGILYGLQLWMYFQSVWSLVKSNSSHYRTRRFYVIYGGILLILLTFSVLSNALFGQEAWIEHRAEMDPAVYLATNISLWYNTLGSAADITVNFMGDGLLIYRCYMIWGSRLWIIAFPFLIYLASTAMAVITVIESALPGASIFVGKSIDFGIAWVSLTVGLNVVVTILISTRLLIMRNVARSVLSPEMAKMYTSIMAILVESALPFSVLGLGFVITYAKSSPTEFAFACVWGTFCAISPQLIILRVAMGAGWSKETVAQVSNPMSRGTLIFAPSTNKGSKVEPAHTQASGAPSSTNYTAGTSTLYPWSKNSNKSEKSLSSDVELAQV